MISVRSNFYQVHQSGIYVIKVTQSKSIKGTWSKFDQHDFDSVNVFSWYMNECHMSGTSMTYTVAL